MLGFRSSFLLVENASNTTREMGEGEERRAKKAGQARAGEAESIAPLPHSSPQCIIPANVPPINRPWMRPTRIYVDSIAKPGGRGFVHRSSARIDSGEGRKSVEKEVERDSEPTLPLHSSRSWEKTSDGIENIGSEYQFRERLMKLPGWPDLLRR